MRKAHAGSTQLTNDEANDFNGKYHDGKTIRTPPSLKMIIFLFLSIADSSSFAQSLGDAFSTPAIEVIYIGEGPDLYARFGHLAIRVKDKNSDWVYNFGATNPTPDLFWRFVRGKAQFWAIAQTYNDTIEMYKSFKRSIYRQPLNLSSRQAKHFAKLLNDFVVKEKRYIYNHFTDNCATRPRDMLNQVLKGKLREKLDTTPINHAPTYRKLVHQGFADSPLFLLLTEYSVGRHLEHKLNSWQNCFHPLLMAEVLQEIKIEGKPLTGAMINVYQAAPKKNKGSPSKGIEILWLITMALLISSSYLVTMTLRQNRRAAIIVFIYGIILGTLSLLPWILRFISPLPELKNNELIFLFFPLDFGLLFLARNIWHRRQRSLTFFGYYLGIRFSFIIGNAITYLIGFTKQNIVWTVLAGIFIAALYLTLHLYKKGVVESSLHE